MIIVSLLHMHGPVLIAEAPTGVTYTNQAGGTMCAQPTAEGFVIPIESPDWEEVASRFEVMLCDMWTHGDQKRPEKLLQRVAVAVDTILHDDVFRDFRIRFDRSRAVHVEWGEAWVPVEIFWTAPVAVWNGTSTPGWLTWENSD